jgi:hypothetical protein
VNESTPIPLLKENEQKLVRLRSRLEDMFRELYLIHDVMVVCGATCDAESADLDPEVSHVLRRCGADKLYGQMKALTNIIEFLGGRTEFTEQQEAAQEILAEAHHDKE